MRHGYRYKNNSHCSLSSAFPDFHILRSIGRMISCWQVKRKQLTRGSSTLCGKVSGPSSHKTLRTLRIHHPIACRVYLQRTHSITANHDAQHWKMKLSNRNKQSLREEFPSVGGKGPGILESINVIHRCPHDSSISEIRLYLVWSRSDQAYQLQHNCEGVII